MIQVTSSTGVFTKKDRNAGRCAWSAIANELPQFKKRPAGRLLRAPSPSRSIGSNAFPAVCSPSPFLVERITFQLCDLDHGSRYWTPSHSCTHRILDPAIRRVDGKGERWESASPDRSHLSSHTSHQRRRGLGRQARRLVIGNGAYKNVPSCPIRARTPNRWPSCCAISASTWSRVPTSPGHDDGQPAQVRQAGPTGADVALFFYAGHGIAVNGTNYLLPVDADLKSEIDVKLGAADRCRPDARTDHGRRQGEAGVPRRLPRQSVRRQIRSAKATRSLTWNPALPK